MTITLIYFKQLSFNPKQVIAKVNIVRLKYSLKGAHYAAPL